MLIILGDAADVAFKILEQSGPFVLGTVFGSCLSGVISYFIYRLGSEERIKRADIDKDRERELLHQLNIANDRIAQLHALGGVQKGKK